jgi:hypothetical protein
MKGDLMKKFFMFLLILLAIGFGAGYFFLNTGTTVDVQYTNSDYQSVLQKTNVKTNAIESINLIAIGQGDYKTVGQQAADVSFSNAEMSALIEEANKVRGPISDFRVAFHDNNNGELSFNLTENFVDFLVEENIVRNLEKKRMVMSPILALTSANADLTNFVVNYITSVAANKPVYASGELTKTSNNSINVRIDSLKVGRVNMNERVISRVELEVTAFVNRFITSSNGFSIEELRVEEGKLYFKGTLPEEINGTELQ